MSDSDSTGHVQSPAAVGTAAPGPAAPRREPVALLVLDAATGRVVAGNPAGRRRLAGTAGAHLARRICDLATAAGPRDGVTVRTWTTPVGAGPDVAAGHRTRVLSTPIEFRSRDCLLMALRDDAEAPVSLPPGTTDGTAVADHGCAVLTLDCLGRIDSWGTTPQRLIGHRAEHVLGADTTLLLPPAARLAGEHHRALTQAYRAGEHRAEGWRLCSDGRLIWAEVTTAPLYDAVDRLLGFAQVIHDLTPVRRLRPGHLSAAGAGTGAGTGTGSGTGTGRTAGLRGVPGQRVTALAPPAGSPARGARRPAGRVPTQRHP